METSTSLQVLSQPPSAIYLDEIFEVKVGGIQPEENLTIALAEHAVTLTLVVLRSDEVDTFRCCVRSSEAEGRFRLQITSLDRRESVTSNSSTVVRYKIFVSPSDEWAAIWYKDEGGRDKCMECVAGVYDCARRLRTEISIPLSLTLCYPNELPVTNQDVLKILGDKLMTNGNAKIRFRVEDVSKNHQGQDFCLKIEPTIDDLSSNSKASIAAGHTPFVTVRSKRNKRTRTAQELGRKSKHLRDQADTSTGLIGYPEANELAQAVEEISHWAETVVSGLPPLLWQVIGFPPDAQGNIDYARPYHSMVNPNDAFAQVTSEYTEKIQPQLRLLGEAFGPTLYPSKSVQRMAESHAETNLYSDNIPNKDEHGRQTSFRSERCHPGGTLVTLRKRASNAYETQTQTSLELPDALQTPNRSTRFRQDSLQSNKLPYNTKKSSPSKDSEQNECFGLESRESEVEFLLAKQFKSVRTGQRLGFPAYSESKELLGFYREFHQGGGTLFVPLDTKDFGEKELQQARTIFSESASAVQSMRACGSVAAMLNHALVYEWSQDLDEDLPARSK